jgi:hypothetical protein
LDEFWGGCRFTVNPDRHQLSLRLPFQSEPDFSYIDLTPFGLAEKEAELPGVFSGFLVTIEHDRPNHAALHIIIQDLLCHIAAIYGILI